MNGRIAATRMSLAGIAAMLALLTSGMAAAQFHLRTAPAPLHPLVEPPLPYNIDPSAAGDGQGNWVVVWTRQLVNLRDIVVARSSDNGSSWTEPATITSVFPGMHRVVPEVATDGEGHWIVTWVELVVDTYTYRVHVARSLDNGATWSAPNTVGTADGPASSVFAASSITTDRSGNWIVVWAVNNDTPTLSAVLVSRSGDNGTTWSAPSVVADNLGYVWSSRPSIATDGAGRWIATWHASPAGIGTPSGIDYAVSLDNGANWGVTSSINTGTSSTIHNQHPHIAFGTGHWLLAWSIRGSGNDTHDILAVRSNDGGDSWSAPQLVDTRTVTGDAIGYPSTESSPRLTTDGSGNWMIAWFYDVGGFVPRDAVARSSDNGATWSSPPARLLPDANHLEWSFWEPCIATDRAGTWLMFWEAPRPNEIALIQNNADILYSRWTSLLVPDADGDNISDVDEIASGTSITNWDTDGDLLSDADEIANGTNPLLADTDGDGVWDGIEIALGTDPLDPFDFPMLPLNRPWLVVTALIAAVIALHGRGGFRFRA